MVATTATPLPMASSTLASPVGPPGPRAPSRRMSLASARTFAMGEGYGPALYFAAMSGATVSTRPQLQVAAMGIALRDRIETWLDGTPHRKLVAVVTTGVVIGLVVVFLALGGGESAIVPDVVGMNIDEASVVVSSANFQLVILDSFTDSAAPGTVILQSPEAGSREDVGGEIVVTVARASEGPAPVPVSPPPALATPPLATGPLVPDVTGMAQTEAEAALRVAGYQVTSTTRSDATAAIGTVISQEPPANTAAAAGATVSLAISAGNIPVIVPDLACVPLDEAVLELTNLGLRPAIGGVGTGEGCTSTENSVTNQEPLAGTSVGAGAVVTLETTQAVAFVPTEAGTSTEPSTPPAP